MGTWFSARVIHATAKILHAICSGLYTRTYKLTTKFVLFLARDYSTTVVEISLKTKDRDIPRVFYRRQSVV